MARHKRSLFPPSQCVCLCHPGGDKRKDCPNCYEPSDKDGLLTQPWHYAFLHGTGRIGTDGPHSVAVAVQPRYADQKDFEKVARHIVALHNKAVGIKADKESA